MGSVIFQSLKMAAVRKGKLLDEYSAVGEMFDCSRMGKDRFAFLRR